MNRLHIHRITSIGAVEDADNPESDLLLFKARPTEPKSGPDGRGSLLNPGRWGASIATRLAETDRALNRIADTQRALRRSIEKEGTMRPRKAEIALAGTVRAEVERLAVEKIETGEAATLIQARPMVWRERPDLVAKSRHESPETVTDGPGKTINDRVVEVIDEATRKASWQPLMKGWGDGKTRDEIITKVRVEMWQTPDGSELRDLDRAFGSKPYTPTTSREIRKSRDGGRYERALTGVPPVSRTP